MYPLKGFTSMLSFLLTDSHTGFVASSHHSRSGYLARQAGLALLASLFIAASAHVAVPLPFTPVPFTLQPFAVLLVGMLFSPAVAFGALVAYLCEGAGGLPVFTPGGLPGVARLLGPTGGYLFAYPVAAAVASALPKLFSSRHRFAAYAVSGSAAMLLIYACGALWFSYALHIPLSAAFAATVTPFAASDAIKVCAAAGIASALKAHGSDSGRQGGDQRSLASKT